MARRFALFRPWMVPTTLALGMVLAACSSQGTSLTSAPSARAKVAPNGAVTLLDGTTAELSSLRHGPALVWFVAAGCASCAASIPTIAKQLSTFSRAKTRVVALGLYGSFDQGHKGIGELTAFGRASAGTAFADPDWTWGLASAGLSTAYDPKGVPDDYFLLDATGHITYQGSVPVSTMGTLLAHLRSLTGSAIAPESSAATSSPVTTLP